MTTDEREVVVVTRWDIVTDDDGNEDVEETRTLAMVEADARRVSVHVSPQMEDSFTFDMGVAEAWDLIQALSRAVVDAEAQDE